MCNLELSDATAHDALDAKAMRTIAFCTPAQVRNVDV
jgi:hypothetical protein